MNTTKKPRRMARPAIVGGDDAASTNPVMTESADAASIEKRVTKQSLVLDLLHQQGGVPLAVIVEATGWQPHTTRAALTGLRKKGHAITKDKVDGVTRYSIGPVTE